jgi:hypothetical protein
MASKVQYNSEPKPRRVEVFRPAAEEQYEVGKDVFFGQEGVAGKILARFTPANRPDDIAYVVEPSLPPTPPVVEELQQES